MARLRRVATGGVVLLTTSVFVVFSVALFNLGPVPAVVEVAGSTRVAEPVPRPQHVAERGRRRIRAHHGTRHGLRTHRGTEPPRYRLRGACARMGPCRVRRPPPRESRLGRPRS
jgi:hypothetical protein